MNKELYRIKEELIAFVESETQLDCVLVNLINFIAYEIDSNIEEK